MQTAQVCCSLLYIQASPVQIPKSKITSGPVESLLARTQITSSPVASLLATTQLRLSALAGSAASAMQNGGQAAAAVPAKEGKDAAQSFPERDGTGESDANNHKLSNVLDKDDESAIEPDVPHELSSSEVGEDPVAQKGSNTPPYAVPHSSATIPCIPCRMQFQLAHGCSTWARGRAGGKAQLCYSCRPRSSTCSNSQSSPTQQKACYYCAQPVAYRLSP